MELKPFRGLRPNRELAARIPSYPYDVIDSDEARRLAEGDSYTFLRVVKPEIDLEPDVSPYDDRVYEKGRHNLERLIGQGWMSRDDEPCYYLYRLEMPGHSQVGIVAAAAVDDYLEGRIRKHELTRADKEKDRTRHIEALDAHAGPVLQCYRRIPELSAIVSGWVARDPDADFTASDGIRHSLWRVSEPAVGRRIEGLFSKASATYIADGHHRAAAAAQVTLARRRGGLLGGAPANYFLTVLFPADQLKILDYNRIVTDLNGLEPQAFLERVRRQGFTVTHNHRNKRPPHRKTIGMYLNGSWFLLGAPEEPAENGQNPAERLDVALLSRHLLEPVLGLGDIRTDKRIDFVGGIRGTEELEKRVDSGRYAVAFAVHPTDIEDVMSVADSGGVMPPKSTWFEPKLRSGMVVLLLGDDAL